MKETEIKARKDYGTMASTDPNKSTKTWSSGSDTDPNFNEDDKEPVSFADLGVKREARIVETYFGKRRPLSGLTRKEWAFAALALVSILAAAGLTIERIVDLQKNQNMTGDHGPDDSGSNGPDVTLAVVLLLTIVFCAFYVINGIFGERPYELLIFIVGNLILMIYCIVNYAQTIHAKEYKQSARDIKLARLIIILVLGPINIVLGAIITREYYLSRNLIFRTVGANLELQDLCTRIFVTESLFKIDLQLELTMVILILKDGFTDWTTLEIVVMVVGVTYAVVWCILGFQSIYRESNILVYILLCFSWCEPAYIIYKFVDVGIDWDNSQYKLIPAAIILAGMLGLVVRIGLCGFMVYVYRNFGKGMREKAYGKMPKESTPPTPPNTASC